MNLSRMLTEVYDKVLNDYDLLSMPTTAHKSQPIPEPDAKREEFIETAAKNSANIVPSDITHHPAMAIPCGNSAELPVSLQLLGKHFDESTIYKAAHAFQEEIK